MPDHERRRRRLLLRERQELDGKLKPHVAVRCNVIRHPDTVEHGEQQQRIFGRLSERFSLLDQQTCSLHGCLGFLSAIALDREEWGYECNLELDLFATQRGRGGQGRDLVERKCELLYGFNQRGALRRALACFAPQPRGFLDLPCLGAMSRQQLGLILGDLRELTFEGCGDSSMKRAPRLAQQHAVSCVLYQCVLEQVSSVRRRAPTV